MKERILLILSLLLIPAGFAFAQTARKTVTNEDLEKYRQARLKSEAEYRANYKRLGMPSPEELQQMEVERQAWLADFARKKAIENQQSEDYFRAQANVLKTEIVNVQAQINYVRGRLGDLPSPQNSIFVRPEEVFAVGVLPGGVFNRGGNFPPNRGGGGHYRQQPPRGTVVGPNVSAAISNAAGAPNPYAGTSLERAGVKAVIGPTNIVRGGRGGYNRYPYYYGGYAAVPYAVDNNSNRREDLVARLSYLEQTKAGLLAQFEALREEARRAGVAID